MTHFLYHYGFYVGAFLLSCWLAKGYIDLIEWIFPDEDEDRRRGL